MMKVNVPEGVTNLKDKLGDSAKVTAELQAIVGNFEQWLAKSKLTFDDFISYSSVDAFSIQSKTWEDKYSVLALCTEKRSGYVQIGETIAYSMSDEEAIYDVALLLLYIACRLDEHDKSGRRDFFYNIAKSFCNDMIK